MRRFWGQCGSRTRAKFRGPRNEIFIIFIHKLELISHQLVHSCRGNVIIWDDGLLSNLAALSGVEAIDGQLVLFGATPEGATTPYHLQDLRGLKKLKVWTWRRVHDLCTTFLNCIPHNCCLAAVCRWPESGPSPVASYVVWPGIALGDQWQPGCTWMCTAVKSAGEDEVLPSIFQSELPRLPSPANIRKYLQAFLNPTCKLPK
eukprot:359985-Chlamydomonas_euryale.AAC.14